MDVRASVSSFFCISFHRTASKGSTISQCDCEGVVTTAALSNMPWVELHRARISQLLDVTAVDSIRCISTLQHHSILHSQDDRVPFELLHCGSSWNRCFGLLRCDAWARRNCRLAGLQLTIGRREAGTRAWRGTRSERDAWWASGRRWMYGVESVVTSSNSDDSDQRCFPEDLGSALAVLTIPAPLVGPMLPNFPNREAPVPS